MKILRYKTFLLPVFLLTSGCSTFNSVDYSNIKSFSAVISDIQGKVLNCSYERGYSIHCERVSEND